MRILILSRNGELYSTKSIYNAAKRRNHFVRIVDHMHCDMVIENGANKVIYEGMSLTGYDAVIPRIGYTVTKYGASVIRQFEAMGVFTTLRAEPLLRTRDKLSCLQVLSSKDIPVPKTLISNNQYNLVRLSHLIEGYPKILKLMEGTHGLGVLKADDASMLETVSEAIYSLKHNILLQEFIKEFAGQDLRAFVVDGKVVAAMLRTARSGEFRSNLHRGGTSQVVTLTEEERKIALASTRIMGLKVAGVDMLRSSRGPLVLEVNASPGLEGIENTTSVDIARDIIEFIEKRAFNRTHDTRTTDH